MLLRVPVASIVSFWMNTLVIPVIQHPHNLSIGSNHLISARDVES